MNIKTNIIDTARSWIGTPYHHQASKKQIGCDCLGLVLGVYQECIGQLPEPVPNYTSSWAETGKHELLLEGAKRWFQEKETKQAEAGDILIFRLRKNTIAKHTAIQTSPIHMVHAMEGTTVTEVVLSHWWKRRTVSVFSFLKLPQETRNL